MKTLYFLGGLPRSGSTLLGSLLNQHSDIYVSPTSPLGDVVTDIEQSFNKVDQQFTFDRKAISYNVYEAVLANFYNHIPKSTILDKHRFWDKTIDILHIDGSHKYEDITRDFETWSKFVTDNGIILLHDTCIESLNGNDYGVKKFFDELDMPKFTFTHCYGLGVICKNEVVLNHIKNNFT